MSAAVGKAIMEGIEAENILEHLAEPGAYLRQQLEALASRHSVIGNVHGLGLVQGIELVRDREIREPATDIARDLPDRMRE